MRLLLAFLALSFFQFCVSSAETPPPGDVIQLEEVIVTATRLPQSIREVPASASLAGREEIERLPAASLPELIAALPGVQVLDHNGNGADPAVVVRGFYGAGENDYVLVLKDGVPLNRAGDSRVDWNALPLEEIESLELVRGPASVLYGDNALGATLQLRTGDVDHEGLAGSGFLRAGSHEALESGLRLAHRVRNTARRMYYNDRSSRGFREHGAFAHRSLGFELEQRPEGGGLLNVGFAWSGGKQDLPGPLPASAMDANRRAVQGIHSGDVRDEDSGRFDLRLDARPLPGGGLLALTGSVSVRSIRETSTLLLDHGVPPEGYVDRQRQTAGERGLRASCELRMPTVLEGLPGVLLLGYELGAVTHRSRWRNLLVPALLDSDERNGRLAQAGILHLRLEPLPVLKLYLGSRYDFVQDTQVRHTRFSPRLGASLDLRELGLRGDFLRGSLWLNASQAFKLPTLEQLYDNRDLLTEFGIVRFSNERLRPQSGRNLEAGMHLGAGADLALDASVYRMEMEDEIDFDLQQYRYRNINRSIHEGVDLEATLRLPAAHYLNLGAAVCRAVCDGGPDDGNRLERVPDRSLSLGGGGSLFGLSYHLQLNHTGEQFIDRGNTETIEAWQTLDLKLGYRAGRIELELSVYNLLDVEYSSSGYMALSQFIAMTDPGADPALRLEYPGSGRRVLAGLNFGI